MRVNLEEQVRERTRAVEFAMRSLFCILLKQFHQSAASDARGTSRYISTNILHHNIEFYNQDDFRQPRARTTAAHVGRKMVLYTTLLAIHLFRDGGQVRHHVHRVKNGVRILLIISFVRERDAR